MTANRGGGFGFPAGYVDEYGEVARPSAKPIDPEIARREQEATEAARKRRVETSTAVLYEVVGGPLTGQRVSGPSPFAGLADWMLKTPGARERALKVWASADHRVFKEDGAEFDAYTAVLGTFLKEVS